MRCWRNNARNAVLGDTWAEASSQPITLHVAFIDAVAMVTIVRACSTLNLIG